MMFKIYLRSRNNTLNCRKIHSHERIVAWGSRSLADHRPRCKLGPVLRFWISEDFTSISLISRGGIPRPTGNVPERLSQAICNLSRDDISREIGRTSWAPSHRRSDRLHCRSSGGSLVGSFAKRMAPIQKNRKSRMTSSTMNQKLSMIATTKPVRMCQESLGEHKPGRIKPGRIKRAALSLQHQTYHMFVF